MFSRTISLRKNNPNNMHKLLLGTLYPIYLNIFKLNSEELLNFLKKNEFKIYSSLIKSKKRFTNINFKQRCALVMGPEKSCVSDIFIKNSNEFINIPMFGNVDSLNLSVSTGIILYKAINQRKFS